MAVVVPPNLKPINSFLKLAKEYDKRDATVAYFCRMYAVQKGIKLDSKSTDCKMFLIGMMDQLETAKKELSASGDESVSNDIVAQAHVENITIKLFEWADTQDRNSVFNKNITKAFYSASLLFEVLTQFGEQNDECKVMQKYSKWKATYLHKCAQSGEPPQPGPIGSGFEDDLSALMNTPSSGLSDLPGSSGGSGGGGGGGNDYEPVENFNLPDIPGNPAASFPPPGNPSISQSFPPPSANIPSIPAPTIQAPAPAPSATGGRVLNPSEIDVEQVNKLCKYAMSALQYEDVGTAVDNLTKALGMLTRK